ncbi:alpha/beta hydrolase [Variovorax sp. EL159]|uniref:alpha/beta hydrolase n=1 Tax=Variovorax sp. EL159 TaxID=1566270 RepID=UPI000880762B|nr:alpha/beta fold hydrolase [Variovorax sp. EL159]SCX45791.1 Pimeloyl-ACP methyl ester carboxylesterase [Variovorax sp. EL159]
MPMALLLSACGGGGSGGVGPFLPPPTVTVTDRRILVAPGVSLHVRDWQSNRVDGITFVLLPGFGANAQHFNSLAPALAKRGRAVAISCRGFGRSDKPLPDATHRYDTQTLVDDVHAVLEALGIPCIVLGGHSLAGNQVTLFAGRYPQRVRGLIYLDNAFDYSKVPRSDEESPLLAEPEPTPADTASLSSMIAFFKRVNRNWSAAMEADLIDKLEVLPDGGVRWGTPVTIRTAMSEAGYAFSPDYTLVHVPGLVLTALPGDRRDMFPWLPATLDAETEQAANEAILLFNRVRPQDTARLFAALPPGSQQATFQPATHADFFIENEVALLSLIDGMGW